METIKLTNIEGFASKSGIDEHGNSWIQDEYECHEEPAACNICEKKIWTGWTCLDGGDFVCDEHVVY